MSKTTSGKKTKTSRMREQTPLAPIFSARTIPEILAALQGTPLPPVPPETLPSHPDMEVADIEASEIKAAGIEDFGVEDFDMEASLTGKSILEEVMSEKAISETAFSEAFVNLINISPGGSSADNTLDRSAAPRYNVTIHEMPSSERPRERLVHVGASAVSTTELLAIQLRTGSSERSALGLAELLLSQFQGLRGLANASVEELEQVKGIGKVKAVEILAAVELGKRLAALTPEEKPCIRSPQDVANLLMPELRDLKKEHLKSLLLDSKNRVMKIMTVSIGILDSSLVHPREVFKDAIMASSAAIIIAHNHPSGDPTPSPEDKRITQRLYEAGQLLGIDLLDHIVIGDQRWISLKQIGAL